jgi:hypothetical protein
MMHTAIIHVEIPDRTTGSGEEEWSAFNDATRTKLSRSQKDVERLAENVWQVNFQNAPAAFAWIVANADRHGLKYKILQLDDAPQWLPVGSDPKPI